MGKSSAIKVVGLGKQYVLGGAEKTDVSFREMLTGALAAPFRRLKRLQGERAEEETFWALRNVDFDVKPGEVVGIIGRNGAGKSTLLKILSRITDPTEGRIEIRGRVSSLLEVGTGFHPELTGRENIFLNGAILGMSRQEIRNKFDEIIAFAEVEKFLDTPVKRYSSGMYVRLAFAVAAHLEPEILIVDEVLAVGDAAFQKKCLGKMQDVGKEGRTVIFVSHNMGAVKSLCSRAFLLNGGQIAAHGDVHSIIDQYLFFGQDVTQSGEISWGDADAPQCDEISLRSIRLLDSKGVSRSLFDASGPIEVEIKYQIRKNIRGMRMIMTLLTGEGVVVLASTDHNVRRDTGEEPGEYTSRCRIPGQLLNGGQYLINIHVGIPGVKALILGREYLSMTIQSAGSHGSTFVEKWPGVVAPTLLWELS